MTRALVTMKSKQTYVMMRALIIKKQEDIFVHGKGSHHKEKQGDIVMMRALITQSKKTSA